MTPPNPPAEPPRPPADSARDAVSWGTRVGAAWVWRLLVLGLGAYVLIEFFARVELVAFSFVLALLFTSVLHPVEKALRRLPGSRSVSAGLTLLIGLAVLGGVGYFIAVQIGDHASQLGDEISNSVVNIKNWLHTGPLHLKTTDLDNLADKVTSAVKSHENLLVSGAVQTVQTVVDVIASVLLILLSTFFLLRDGDQIWDWVVRLLPERAHHPLDQAARSGWRTLSGYVRSQVLIALFHAVTVTIVLLVLRIPLAAALGVVIFLGSFVPIIGLIVAGALCTAIAGLAHGITAAIVVAVAIIILVQIEGNVLQPLIMSRNVEIHPLGVALVVLTGTTLGGVVGALISVPIVSFLNTTIIALRHPPGEAADVGRVPPADEDEPMVAGA